MPRIARRAPGGIVYHVLNRGVGRMRLFEEPGDYAAFLRAVRDTLAVRPVRLLGLCLMPNHWHLLLWPRRDGDLAAFMQRLTITHVRRWVEHRHDHGNGHVYQGRYKSFPAQSDAHLLTVLRYVERNAQRAGLVARAQDWPYGSLSLRLAAAAAAAAAAARDDATATADAAESAAQAAEWYDLLHDGPVALPADWVARVNAPQSQAEETALRLCVTRGRPFGADPWVATTARRLGLAPTLRPRGRPRKQQK